MPSTDHERRDALPVGAVLRDFTIQAVIGHGGFGIVYRAGHNELDLTVAIKEYLPVELAVREGATVQPRSGTDRKDFEDGLRRFRDEAQALIDFDSHPSIVSCREFFRANGTAYLVMAYEEGQSLAELLGRRESEGRPFTESDLLTVMTPVLEGLARVHAAGVLHRDIKPSNILIRRSDGRPVLIDFGAAKQAAAKYSKSQAPYTEGYAALEQVADTGKLGPWTDMYGVGAVMWRMVAGGNRPWEPPHPVRVELRSHAVIDAAADPMPSAGELGKGRFPPRLLEAVDQCLRLRETKRIQDARGLLEVLRAASDQSPSAVPAETRDPPAEGTASVQRGRGTSIAPVATVSRGANPRVGKVVLAGLAVGLGLALATWWSLGSSWTNSLDMEFVWIPAGEFQMGTPMHVGTDYDDETRHEVRISRGFWLGKYEVMQREWGAVMGTNPSGFLDCGPRCPVDGVSWEDAQAFIRELNERESGSGYEYRLPTEAEWEYAARAGTTGIRYGELDEVAWHSGNSDEATHTVGQKRANVWGLHDMLGNVSEWTGDWYGEYASGLVTDPQGPSIGTFRVIRGGSWNGNAAYVRSAYRSARPLGSRRNNFGFRLVRSLERPWERDWEALGEGIEDLSFAAAAQAYIARYRTVREAGVWVARAEGLLARLTELEAVDRTRREVGESWTNSLGMEFMWIPAGRFEMGSPKGEVGPYGDERQHAVRISEGFWMGKYEVTQGEWEAVAVMGANPSFPRDCGQRCPVDSVSWFDVEEYIRRLNWRESGKGYRYRLPTEAEWEYAARAGTTGKRYGELDEIAWYDDNSGGGTHPVGQKRASAWGLHDMLGNVSEWTGDWYGEYASGLVTDPQGSSTGSSRVARGGGWGNNAWVVRSALRASYSPGYRGGIGFRLVRTK